jgi:hypothetical protein
MVKSRVDLLAKAAVKILRRSKDGRSTLALTDAVHGGGADDGSGTWRYARSKKECAKRDVFFVSGGSLAIALFSSLASYVDGGVVSSLMPAIVFC